MLLVAALAALMVGCQVDDSGGEGDGHATESPVLEVVSYDDVILNSFTACIEVFLLNVDEDALYDENYYFDCACYHAWYEVTTQTNNVCAYPSGPVYYQYDPVIEAQTTGKVVLCPEYSDASVSDSLAIGKCDCNVFAYEIWQANFVYIQELPDDSATSCTVIAEDPIWGGVDADKH